MTEQATGFGEGQWEELALEVLGELGWKHLRGAAIAPGSGERESWDELVIPSRLLKAMRTLNPTVPNQYLQQALAEITSPKSTDAVTENHRLHGYLVDGFRGVSYIDNDGTEVTPTIRLISTDPDANDWLAVNQVIVTQRDYRRRFDIVLYCNGLPVSIIEVAREVAAEGNRGARFSPLGEDELAFFDAVAQNESAVAEQGEGVLADIARSWCR